MASRDLTKKYVEYRRNALRRRSDNNKRYIAAGGAGGSYTKLGSQNNVPSMDEMLIEEGGIQMNSLSNNGQSNNQVKPDTPSWVEDVDKINDILAGVSRQMGMLQNLHSTRLGSVFGKDINNMEERIEKLTREITDGFRAAEKLLHRIGSATKRSGGQDAMVGANIQRSLAKRLQELSVKFRQSQRKYLSEVQAQKSGTIVDNDSKFGIDLSAGHTSVDDIYGGFNQSQQVVVDDMSQAIQTRDAEIIQIAQSIEELGTIFKELAVLVIDQGTVLDRIDYNMEAVVESTKTGVQQLERAEKAQKSARPLKCIICLCTTIFILLVLLVIKKKFLHLFF